MQDRPLKLDTKLSSRSARVDLKATARPYFLDLGGGVALGYQPSRKANKSGKWHVRWALGDGTNKRKRLALADDYVEANGTSVLSFAQAFARARDYAKHDGDAGKLAGFEPITVAEAFGQYKADLVSRGGNVWNATQPANHLAAYRDATRVDLLSKAVQDTIEDDWQSFRDWVRANRRITAGAVNRISRPLKACLNLAARKDRKRITNASAWKYGLADLKHRPVVNRKPFKRAEAEAIIDAAYEHGEAFGLWVNANALGIRPSQLAALNVDDFNDDDPTDPFLKVTASRKGKKKERNIEPVSVSEQFGRRIRKSIADREAARNEPLFAKPSGKRWSAGDNDVIEGFRKIMVDLGFAKRIEGRAKGLGHGVGRYGPTMYALRHTAITEQLKANTTDLLSLAKTFDTSPGIIDNHYAKEILGETRRKMRAAIIDAPARKRADKVVPLKARARA